MKKRCSSKCGEFFPITSEIFETNSQNSAFFQGGETLNYFFFPILIADLDYTLYIDIKSLICVIYELD